MIHRCIQETCRVGRTVLRMKLELQGLGIPVVAKLALLFSGRASSATTCAARKPTPTRRGNPCGCPECGLSTVLAVFALLLFSVLGLVLCSMLSVSSMGSLYCVEGQQVLQIAEAGRQYAIWRLINIDPSWTTDGETEEFTFGKGTYTLNVYDDADKDVKVVVSKGYIPQEQNHRAMRVVRMEGAYKIIDGAHPIYNYAIYTDSATVMNKSEDGVVQSVTDTVLTKDSSTEDWVVDEHIGRMLYITSGTAAGKTYVITDNDATTLTCDGVDMSGDGVSAGDEFAIRWTETTLLIFDQNEYILSTRELNDSTTAGRDAHAHSNNDIIFRNGSGRVVDGTVYSAKSVIKEGSWTGTPWVLMEEGVDVVAPPYLGDETRDWYRERAQANGTYYDVEHKIFTGLVELGSALNPAIIFVEGKVTIGNAKYHRPGNTNRYGVGTIVSGGENGGDLTITGKIIPASGNPLRTKLALVSFFDTIYKGEIIEPPYYEGARILDIKDGSGVSKLTFNNENITITYQRGSNQERYAWLAVANHDLSFFQESAQTTPSGGIFSWTFDSSILSDDWYYLRVETYQRTNKGNLKGRIYGNFIVGVETPGAVQSVTDTVLTKDSSTPDWVVDEHIGKTLYIVNGDACSNTYNITDNDATTLTCNGANMSGDGVSGGDRFMIRVMPTHHIRTYTDSTFTEETSAFDDMGTVYLEIYKDGPATSINNIEGSDYTPPGSYNPPWVNLSPVANYLRCSFTLPSLTEDWWYNVLVVTQNPATYFTKQIYIKSTGAVPIYACIHSNDYFKLEEYANLDIIGNLTARFGFILSQESPLSNIRVTYDTKIFRENRRDENALPGAVQFVYQWSEEGS